MNMRAFLLLGHFHDSRSSMSKSLQAKPQALCAARFKHHALTVAYQAIIIVLALIINCLPACRYTWCLSCKWTGGCAGGQSRGVERALCGPICDEIIREPGVQPVCQPVDVFVQGSSQLAGISGSRPVVKTPGIGA